MPFSSRYSKQCLFEVGLSNSWSPRLLCLGIQLVSSLLQFNQCCYQHCSMGFFFFFLFLPRWSIFWKVFLGWKSTCTLSAVYLCYCTRKASFSSVRILSSFNTLLKCHLLPEDFFPPLGSKLCLSTRSSLTVLITCHVLADNIYIHYSVVYLMYLTHRTDHFNDPLLCKTKAFSVIFM